MTEILLVALEKAKSRPKLAHVFDQSTVGVDLKDNAHLSAFGLFDLCDEIRDNELLALVREKKALL